MKLQTLALCCCVFVFAIITPSSSKPSESMWACGRTLHNKIKSICSLPALKSNYVSRVRRLMWKYGNGRIGAGRHSRRGRSAQKTTKAEKARLEKIKKEAKEVYSTRSSEIIHKGLSTRQTKRLLRRKRGVTDHCCDKPCTKEYLQNTLCYGYLKMLKHGSH